MSFSTKKTRRSRIDFKDDKGLTEQSHKKACDIHNIMARYEKTGLIEHVNAFGGQYGDFPSGLDLHAAMNVVANANSLFESIPADIRSQFHNDPAEFLDWIQDENNREEIKEMGFSTDHLPETAVPQPQATGTATAPATPEPTAPATAPVADTPA